LKITEKEFTPCGMLAVMLKGECQEIFVSGFFHESLPQAPENNIRVISNFFKNSRRYSQVKVHHRCSATPVANLQPVSMTPVAKLPPVSTTPAANFGTSSACVVNTGTGVKNTGGKFAAGVENCMTAADTLK
jgi:hypothetical protein